MSERNRKIAEYLKAIALLIESDSVLQTCEQPLVIPEGWRELSPDEVPRLGDMAEQLGAWRARKSVGSKAYELYEVRHIRKLEPAVPAEWVPKTGDWVKVNKHVGNPGRRKYWNEQMDLYNHKIGCVSAVNVDRGFATIAGFTREGYYHWQFDFDWLEPAEAPADHIADVNKMVNPSETTNSSTPIEWIPKVGDNVTVPSTSQQGFIVYIDDREYCPVLIKHHKSGSLSWHSFEDLQEIEPANTPAIPDSSIPDPGPGYRLLSKDPPEPVVKGDEFFDRYYWLESGGWVHEDGLQGTYYYRRKIEAAEELADHIPDATKMVNPSETPNSSTWIPKVGDKVRVVRTDRVRTNGKLGIVADMPGYEYAVRMESEGFTLCHLKADGLELIEAANPSETPKSSTVKPGYFDDIDGVWVDEPNPFDGRKTETKPTEWIPKVGDKVGIRGRNGGLVGETKCFVVDEEDAAHDGMRFKRYRVRAVGFSFNAKAEDLWLLEAAPDPGEGYRLLSKDQPEALKSGDQYWNSLEKAWCATFLATQSWDELYRRKIEVANVSETPNSSITDPLNCIGHICDLSEPTGVTCPVDSCDLNTGLREMPSPTAEYRGPTYADLANGPIEVEVCDDKTHESHWKKRMLYGILPSAADLPYISTDPECRSTATAWKYARIKVS